jgi:hypothetical protein
MRRAAAGKPPPRSTSTAPRSDPASTTKPLPVGVAYSTEVRSLDPGEVEVVGVRMACLSVRPRSKGDGHGRVTHSSGPVFSGTFPAAAPPLRSPHHGPRCTDDASRAHSNEPVLLASSRQHKKLCATTCKSWGKKKEKREAANNRRLGPPPIPPPPPSRPPKRRFSTFRFRLPRFYLSVRRSARARNPIIAPSPSHPHWPSPRRTTRPNATDRHNGGQVRVGRRGGYGYTLPACSITPLQSPETSEEPASYLYPFVRAPAA